MSMLIQGLITGMLFGFLMQKSNVLRYERQINLLRRKDMTVLKFMLSAVMVGMIGIHFMVDLDLAVLNPKSLILGANILGGLLFGVGWGLLGYCPGTAAGALGEGRWDASFGLLGILLGGMVYAEAYPSLKSTVLTWGELGKRTISSLTGIHHWIIIPVICLVFVGLFGWFEKNDL